MLFGRGGDLRAQKGGLNCRGRTISAGRRDNKRNRLSQTDGTVLTSLKKRNGRKTPSTEWEGLWKYPTRF